MQGGHGPPSSIPSVNQFSVLGFLLSFTSRYRNLGPEVLYEYDLFGVICHEGQIDNGHYVNYEHEVSTLSLSGQPVLIVFLTR